MMKKNHPVILVLLLALALIGCKEFPGQLSMKSLATLIINGDTAADFENRVLIIDTRSSTEYIEGHITDALNIPYDMIAESGQPLYTNGYDEVSTTASDQLADSWFAHMLINQLVNDFVTTYQDAQIICYGPHAGQVKRITKKIGYTDVSKLIGGYAIWKTKYLELVEMCGPGVVSLDQEAKSFEFTGFINSANYENVSTKGTHHAIVYSGGGLAYYGMLQADITPFCFQELLTYLGASPEGNMADGIFFGDADEYGSKHVDGQHIEFFVTWDGADCYYPIEDLFEEKAGAYDEDPGSFTALGIEPRIGGTRESNINWNPGCIFCMYSCVCGITSNSKANDDTWFADGGIYDLMNLPDDPRNFYAGRYYPRSDLLPGAGEQIIIKATVMED